MSSKKRLSSEERRDEILNAALPLFAGEGFRNTTTKRIAEAAGVSEALLYKHFPSKKAIFEAIGDSCTISKEEGLRFIESLEPGSAALVHLLYLLTSAIVLGDHGSPEKTKMLFRLVVQSCFDDGEFVRTMLEARLVATAPFVAKCLTEADRQGELVPSNIKGNNRYYFAHHFAAGIALFTQANVLDYGGPAEDVVDQAVEFSLRGIGLKPEVIEKYFQPQMLRLHRMQVFEMLKR